MHFHKLLSNLIFWASLRWFFKSEFSNFWRTSWEIFIRRRNKFASNVTHKLENRVSFAFSIKTEELIKSVKMDILDFQFFLIWPKNNRLMRDHIEWNSTFITFRKHGNHNLTHFCFSSMFSVLYSVTKNLQ